MLSGTVETAAVPHAADVVLSQLVLSLAGDPGRELAALRQRTTVGGTLRVPVLGVPDRMRAFAAY